MSRFERLTLGVLGSCLLACGGAEPLASATDGVKVTAPWQIDPARCGDQQADPGELCDARDPAVACADLAASYAGGFATCRADCRGWDVRQCSLRPPASWPRRARTAPVKSELVRPASRDPLRFELARCNDGSPAEMRVSLSPSGSRTWIFHLQGGHVCDDVAFSCATRAADHPGLTGTSTLAADGRLGRISATGVFDARAALNPAFHDANKVYVGYCSSDGFSGARKFPRGTSAGPWFFSGRHIVRASLQILIQRFGLDDSDAETAVLFSGTSAGGMGVLANAHMVRRHLPATSSRDAVRLLVDGAFFPEWRGSNGVGSAPHHELPEIMLDAHDYWGARLNPRCERAVRQRGLHPSRCYFGSVIHDFITSSTQDGLPMLVQQSQQDNVYMGAVHLPVPDAAWRVATLGLFNRAGWFFSGPDAYHTISASNVTGGGAYGVSYGPSWRQHATLQQRMQDPDSFSSVLADFWGSPHGSSRQVIW